MSDMPIVTLGGVKYPVPPLVPRQQRHVIPALMRISQHKAATGGDSSLLTQTAIDDMLLVVFWGAIEPNDKSVKFETFLDMPSTIEEVFTAIPVVQAQTGLFGGAPGEAEAAKRPTGTK